jgi:hypothetical protein
MSSNLPVSYLGALEHPPSVRLRRMGRRDQRYEPGRAAGEVLPDGHAPAGFLPNSGGNRGRDDCPRPPAIRGSGGNGLTTPKNDPSYGLTPFTLAVPFRNFHLPFQNLNGGALVDSGFQSPGTIKMFNGFDVISQPAITFLLAVTL